ncbi:MAG: mechanosensitive ion channel [Deltaproteobacteria bacterium]|nr:mechanosensitive ion channel [Deltaproteobacteria bacterium]
MDLWTRIVTYPLLGIDLWVYGASFLAVLGGFVGKRIVTTVFRRLLRASERTTLPLDEVVLDALVRPLEWAAMVAGVFLAVLILPLPKEPVDIDHYARAIATATSVVLGVWFSIRLSDGLTGLWQKRAQSTDTRLDDQLVPIVRRSARVFLLVIGVVLVLQNLGYSVASLLAGLGIGGVALAMASKDTVANLFGSFVIFLDKPFQIGDWIETGSIEGTVEEVGLRTTRVRTFSDSLITVPNANFTTIATNNWSQMRKRRIKTTIGVTYSTRPDQVEQLVQEIRQLILDDERLRSDFFLVNFDNFGPSSLDIFLYCFTVTTNWAEYLEVKQDLFLEIMRRIEARGLAFAFPTQTVHLETDPPAHLEVQHAG